MHPSINIVGLALVLSVQAQAQSPADKSSVPSPAVKVDDTKKLGGDTFISIGEAKSLITAHNEEKRRWEAERQAMLAKAAKLNARERAALVTDFFTATETRQKKIRDEQARVADLTLRVRLAERPATEKPSAGTGSK
jgi:hypothetical protein